jgi:YD repeat-containing protein
LRSVKDALGQVTTIAYWSDDESHTENPPDYFLIHTITDPFGRVATFDYNSNFQLWKITDAIGIVSEFLYEDQDGDGNFITALITPYKRTDFSHPQSAFQDGGNSRVIQAVDHETGATERAEFVQYTTVIPATEEHLPAIPGPSGSPIPIDNTSWGNRNSFFWDKKATSMYPPDEQGQYDYTKAKLIHFLHLDGDTVGSVKEREKMPLENAVYYLYAGQADTRFEGSNGSPSYVARLLDDGSTQVFAYEYDSNHHLTKSTDPRGRITSYQYDPTNDIDLVAVFQGTDPIFSSTYNDFHQPVDVTDAAGQITRYTYTAE